MGRWADNCNLISPRFWFWLVNWFPKPSLNGSRQILGSVQILNATFRPRKPAGSRLGGGGTYPDFEPHSSLFRFRTQVKISGFPSGSQRILGSVQIRNTTFRPALRPALPIHGNETTRSWSERERERERIRERERPIYQSSARERKREWDKNNQ